MATTAAILLVAAVLLFIMELLLPGGVIGAAALICLISGIVMLFMVDVSMGLIAVVVTVLLSPLAFATFVKMFPHTPVARLLTLRTQQPSGTGAIQYDSARDQNPAELVGLSGEAVSHMRPVGICRFDSRRLECISISGMLDPGTRVEVVSVSGIEVKVKAV